MCSDDLLLTQVLCYILTIISIRCYKQAMRVNNYWRIGKYPHKGLTKNSLVFHVQFLLLDIKFLHIILIKLVKNF